MTTFQTLSTVYFKFHFSNNVSNNCTPLSLFHPGLLYVWLTSKNSKLLCCTITLKYITLLHMYYSERLNHIPLWTFGFTTEPLFQSNLN